MWASLSCKGETRNFSLAVGIQGRFERFMAGHLLPINSCSSKFKVCGVSFVPELVRCPTLPQQVVSPASDFTSPPPSSSLYIRKLTNCAFMAPLLLLLQADFNCKRADFKGSSSSYVCTDGDIVKVSSLLPCHFVVLNPSCNLCLFLN